MWEIIDLMKKWSQKNTVVEAIIEKILVWLKLARGETSKGN